MGLIPLALPQPPVRSLTMGDRVNPVKILARRARLAKPPPGNPDQKGS